MAVIDLDDVPGNYDKFDNGSKPGPLDDPLDEHEINLLTDIVEYADLEESSDDLLLVSFAEFLIDFGPWKKGEKVDTLALHTWVKQKNFKGPIIETMDVDDSNQRICQVKLVPTE